MIADLKSELADGTASSARMRVAPLLCPANVMVEPPPKDDATVLINFIAFITSLTAKFVRPSGDMKPSCTSDVREISAIVKTNSQLQGDTEPRQQSNVSQ